MFKKGFFFTEIIFSLALLCLAILSQERLASVQSLIQKDIDDLEKIWTYRDVFQQHHKLEPACGDPSWLQPWQIEIQKALKDFRVELNCVHKPYMLRFQSCSASKRYFDLPL